MMILLLLIPIFQPHILVASIMQMQMMILFLLVPIPQPHLSVASKVQMIIFSFESLCPDTGELRIGLGNAFIYFKEFI